MNTKQYKSVPQESFFDSMAGGFLKGLLFACILTLILLSISALIITYTPIDESVIFAFSMICVIISAVFGGMTSAKRAQSRGFLKGALCGGAYILVLYIIAALTSDKPALTSHTAILFVIGIASGALGGIIGINSNRQRKR